MQFSCGFGIAHRRLGPVLGGRQRLPKHGQLCQERLYLHRAHFLRMALAAVQNDAARSVQAGDVGADAVVPDARLLARALQQLEPPRCRK